MLSIVVPGGKRSYDAKRNLFYHVDKDTTIELEHSLISLQKWESKWHKPFLETKDKTYEETIDYIRCMCLSKNIKEDVFYCIPEKEMNKISEYIEDPMTATWFSEHPGSSGLSGPPRRKQLITAEIIYYWMISNNIPSEYRKWHLNQLLTLIRVFNVKNSEMVNRKQKRSRNAILRDYKAINEANKKKFNTKG